MQKQIEFLLESTVNVLLKFLKNEELPNAMADYFTNFATALIERGWGRKEALYVIARVGFPQMPKS